MVQVGSFPQKEAPKLTESFQETPEQKSVETPETSPEQIVAPEQTPEQEIRESQESSEQTTAAAAEPAQQIAIALNEPSRLEKEVEFILSEDLTDLFLAMPSEKQLVFKQKGEETTVKVYEILNSSKVNVKKIFKLIREWLKLIPGVNRFYLEQEAKLKTDKILLVYEEEKEKGIDSL